MKTFCVLFIAAIASPLLVFAQDAKPRQRPDATQQRREEEQNRNNLKRSKAVSLVEETVREAALWNDHQAAVSVLTEAADLLWDENPTARVWLAKAWDLIAKFDEPENSGELRQIWRGSLRSPLRTRVLTVARKHDLQLAERFLKSLEETESQGDRGAFDDHTARSEQLLRLAIAAIETNPAMAVSLAERSLPDGISFNLQTVLLRLRQKDPGLANRLFDSALARLKNSNAAFSESQVLASYLFNPGQVLARLPNGSTSVAVVQTQLPEQTPAKADPVRARHFLTVVHRMMLFAPLPTDEQSQAAGEFILLANSLAQPFQNYAPDLWPSIEVRAAQFAAKMTSPASRPTSGTNEEVQEAARNGASTEEFGRLRVDALERAAEKESNPIVRKLKFAEASLATMAKDLERGKDLAGRIEGDDELREKVIAFLFYRATLTFLSESDLQKAEEIGLMIPSSLERALALIAVAQRLAAFKPRSEEETLQADATRQRAIELLFEADKSLARGAASSKTAKIRLGKVAVSNLVDVSQAFSDFEQAIVVINRLEKFDARDASAPRFGVSGFTTTEFTIPHVDFGFGCRSALEPLVRQDFDLTAATIDRLASPSTRGTFRLEVARQVLQSIPKPPLQMKTVLAK